VLIRVVTGKWALRYWVGVPPPLIFSIRSSTATERRGDGCAGKRHILRKVGLPSEGKDDGPYMGNPQQIQTQVTPPAVLHPGTMNAKHRTGGGGDIPLSPAIPTKTYGVKPEVSRQASSVKLSPTDCTSEQLFEIVIDVAQRFRTAKEVVAEHRNYIQRLKTDVFKVRFGSMGIKVPVTCRTEEGLPAGRMMYWKEFCETQFGVSADWINRICNGKEEGAEEDDRGTSTPDWKSTLLHLINALEQCGDSLPLLAIEALHTAQEVLESKPDHEVASLEIGGDRRSSELLIARADARHIPLADNSVQCVITSPPYWGLRKYAGNQELVWGEVEGCGHEWEESQARGISGGTASKKVHTHGTEKFQIVPPSTHGTCLTCGAWRGAFGLEPTIDAYVQHTVEILREVRRVLRDDGVVFWNIGDSYSGSGAGGGGNRKGNEHGQHDAFADSGRPKDRNLKPKNLCLIPARIALAVQADGWWVRSDIIWASPNPMPESVTDRPTDSYEHILMLTKSAHYYWNSDAVKEPTTDLPVSWEFRKDNGEPMRRGLKENGDFPDPHLGSSATGRNLRNVWTFATQPYKGGHFAAFPDKLPLQCIKAACAEKGCCRFCATPWKRVTDVGWAPGCKCRGQRGITKPCLILDPFGGAGSTALAARELKQDCVLMDISEDYVEMMVERLKGKKAETSNGEIDSSDPLRHVWSHPGSADIDVGIEPPHQASPAPEVRVLRYAGQIAS
jgi:DNA modification methylase